MNDSKDMAKLAVMALEEKKGEDIKIIDIRKVSVLADYFIIAHGNNVNQVQAMADNVEEMLGKSGYICKQTEGYGSGNWILMDYGDIIVHAFNKEDRLFYDLERIWRDGSIVTSVSELN
ncbi:ribosome silencing factor [Clostridium sp. MCC353]|uniref:ribosome silencing factor n=1 Tax=Clostridium sp. MCC353 TaxID=2592646 RepID=UPI001C01E776|nr:ribosome silencing factor [Clostridium sp. MCC353]MBT9776966.1 ribosome silencing factor [Clostridium sp. MCC353]